MAERNITQDLADALVERDINVHRVEAAVIALNDDYLRQLQRAMLKALDKYAPFDVQRQSAQFLRLQRAVNEIDTVLTRVYREIENATRVELSELAIDEADALRTTTRNITQARTFANTVPTSTLEALATDLIVEGAPAAEHWKRQRVGVRQHFLDAMRKGMKAGEGYQNLSKRVGRLMNLAKHHSDALVITSINSVQNASRFEVYKRNRLDLRGYQALATLDRRTSEICKARSGMAWTNTGLPMRSQGAPIIRGTSRFPGPPPWHYRCRTRLIPILAGSEPLLDLTLENWLSRHSETRARAVLGPRRYDLWKEGKITALDLIDQTGRPLTVKELKAKAAGG